MKALFSQLNEKMGVTTYDYPEVIYFYKRST